jgi:hypothetical protein
VFDFYYQNISQIKETKMKMPKFLQLFVCSCIALLVCFGVANAQPASVTISPASIDTKVKRGASYTQNFTLTNNSGNRLLVRCTFTDLWYDENNKRLNGRAGTLPRSASLWAQFSPAEIIVEPNSSAVVKAVITVPQSVSGSYYTVPNFEIGTVVTKTAKSENYTKSADSDSLASALIGIKFRGLMMFTTEDGAEYNVEIMSGKISPPTVSSELEINLDLRNRGTAHAKVRGSFAILNSSGALVGRGNIDEKRYLPTQRDFIKSTWAGDLPPGKYTCLITLTYNRVGLEPTSLVYELPFTVK